MCTFPGLWEKSLRGSEPKMCVEVGGVLVLLLRQAPWGVATAPGVAPGVPPGGLTGGFPGLPLLLSL